MPGKLFGAILITTLGGSLAASNAQSNSTTMLDGPELNPNRYDDIVLNFGVTLWDLPNRQDWDRVASEFVENDPEVGGLKINQQGNNYQEWAAENDCFYLDYDSIIEGNAPDSYLALNTLMNVDPTFDPDTAEAEIGAFSEAVTHCLERVAPDLAAEQQALIESLE